MTIPIHYPASTMNSMEVIGELDQPILFSVENGYYMIEFMVALEMRKSREWQEV